MFVRGDDQQIVGLAGLVLDACNIGTINDPELWVVVRQPGNPTEQDPADWELLTDVPRGVNPDKVLDEVARLFEAGRRVVDVRAIVAEMMQRAEASETAGVRA